MEFVCVDEGTKTFFCPPGFDEAPLSNPITFINIGDAKVLVPFQCVAEPSDGGDGDGSGGGSGGGNGGGSSGAGGGVTPITQEGEKGSDSGRLTRALRLVSH